MKVQDLLEAYYKLGVSGVSNKKSEDGGKIAKLHGAVPDWLLAMNDHMKDPITPAKVAEARPKIKASAEYKALIDAGWKDESSKSAESKGTFVMIRPDGQRFHALVTGKINDRTTMGGGVRQSPVPRIVPTDAVATVVKTMTQTLKHLGKMKVMKEAEQLSESQGLTFYAAAKKEGMTWLVNMLDTAGSKKLKDGSMWDADESGDGIFIPVKQAKEIIEKLKAAGHKVKELKYGGEVYSLTIFAKKSTKNGISVSLEDLDSDGPPKVYSFKLMSDEDFDD